jgi:HK97 gp10 family phage protein
MPIESKGQDEAIKELDNLDERIEEETQVALEEILDGTVELAKEYAPSKSGKLEDSIVGIIDNGEVTVTVEGEAAEYADFIEFGDYELGERSSYKGAEVGPGFIERAVEDFQPQADEIMDQAIGRALGDQ